MEKKKIDICCVGHITRDKIITPEKTTFMAGGTSYYCACALNRLPKGVTFNVVTAIGPESQPDVDALRKQGIDVIANASPASVFFENSYGRNQDNRQQRVLAKAKPFSLDMLSGVDARIYHLGSLLADDFPPAMVEQLADRGMISIDVQGYLRRVVDSHVEACDWADKRRLLPLTHVLKLNEHEMEDVTGLKDPHEVARTIARWGVGEVVITLGSYGSMIYAGGEFYDIPALRPRHVVDATGCGDTYSAGYLYYRCKGATPAEAGLRAAAMCTLKLEHNGPFDGTIDDIERVIGERASL